MDFLNTKKMSEQHKGILLLIGGVLILLYAFNFFARWLNLLVVALGVIMLIYGFMKLGGLDYINKLLKKK